MSTKKSNTKKETSVSGTDNTAALNAARVAAGVKENTSTEGAKKSAAIQEEQAKAAESKTPVGIDFTDPEQRKKDQEEARQQNEKDVTIPQGISIKK